MSGVCYGLPQARNLSLLGAAVAFVLLGIAHGLVEDGAALALIVFVVLLIAAIVREPTA